ncbi:MAG: DUF305 domain-containing protein [Gemmatimonadota bacterium]
MYRFHRTRVVPAALAAALLLAACSSGEGGGGDAAPADTAAESQTAVAPAPSSDTSMAGMQHAPARDADQEFLRMMVDHHQGLLQMAQQAVEKGSTPEVQAEGRTLLQKQQTEQQEMLGILQREYNDTHQPTVMPSNRAMADSLAGKTGTDFDMAFRMNVIAHHQEGIRMTDQFLPRLTRPEVRTMAERSKQDQAKDIQELEAKMGH